MPVKHKEKLAILGGPKAAPAPVDALIKWPIITEEDESAVLEVLRDGRMSQTDVTMQFEKEFAAWMGSKYALAHNTGTAAIHGAMYGCGIGVGHEVIAPSATYWASILQCMSLGATPIFADVAPGTIAIDPNDIEHRITERTRAIVAVHYVGVPCDMDPIMEIAERRNLKVIEDVSHAQGALYKGRMCGTIGHVGAMSLMTGKAFAIGEGGILVTDDREIYERAIAFGHYERTYEGAGGNYTNTDKDFITLPSLTPYRQMPLGGYKYRMHQLSSAVGRVQLKYFPQRMAEINRAMNLFWEKLEHLPALRPYLSPKDSGSTVGACFLPHMFYNAEEVGGVPLEKFVEAVRAEGGQCSPAICFALHLHPLYNTADVYGHGKPTRLAHTDRDVRQPEGSLPETESLKEKAIMVAWLKRRDEDIIAQQASAYRKVIENIDRLKG